MHYRYSFLVFFSAIMLRGMEVVPGGRENTTPEGAARILGYCPARAPEEIVTEEEMRPLSFPGQEIEHPRIRLLQLVPPYCGVDKMRTYLLKGMLASFGASSVGFMYSLYSPGELATTITGVSAGTAWLSIGGYCALRSYKVYRQYKLEKSLRDLENGNEQKNLNV